MDPIGMIGQALVAGAVAAAQPTAEQAVKDAYAAVKRLILDRFGKKGDVAYSLEGVERKPQSQERQADLEEELRSAGAGEDEELLAEVRKLRELLEALAPAPAAGQWAQVRGDRNIVAQGRSVVATDGGVAIGGDVQGGVHLGGKPEEGRKQS